MNDIRKQFLSAIQAGDAKTAKVLGKKIRAQKLPPISLNIIHTDGVYSLHGQEYSKIALKEHLRTMQKEHRFLFFVIDNSGDNKAFDFLNEFTMADKLEIMEVW